MSIANKIVILIIVCSLFNHAFSFIPLKTPELYGVSKELLYTGKGVSKGYTNYIYNHDSVFITSYDTNNIRVSMQKKVIVNKELQQVDSYDKDNLNQWKQIFIYNSYKKLDTLKEFSVTGNLNFALERFYVAEYDTLKQIRWYRGFEYGASDPFESDYYEWDNGKISKISLLRVDKSVERYSEISYAGDEIQKITEFDSAGGYKSRVELEYNGSELSKVSTFRGDSLLGYSTFQYNTSAIAYVSERNQCSHIRIQQISDRIIIQSPLTQVAKISLFSIAGSKLCKENFGKGQLLE